ncbi:MAG TPA: hypothetical protein VGJ29_11855 [Vicinamibacterales bacterium]|jgi:hypothetical protein
MRFIVAALLAIVAPSNVTGTWNMALDAGHVIPTPLVLKQDGKTLTGTIALPTQDITKRVEVRLTGELVDDAFTLSGTVDHAKEPTTLTIDGKVLADGTLEGHLDLPGHAHLPWTAERLKERTP